MLQYMYYVLFMLHKQSFNMRFPNKVLLQTYTLTKGKTFTWSPGKQLFFDEEKNSNYNYNALIWLQNNGYMQKLPFNSSELVTKWIVK